MALVTFIALLIISLTAFNYFLFAPKDYPLRFNRKTGKVYVYDYVNLHVWHLAETLTALFKFPFFLPTRPVEKVFDWQDIQAVETYYMTSIKGVNKTTRSIYCVVCAPYDHTDSRQVHAKHYWRWPQRNALPTVGMGLQLHVFQRYPTG